MINFDKINSKSIKLKSHFNYKMCPKLGDLTNLSIESPDKIHKVHEITIFKKESSSYVDAISIS